MAVSETERFELHLKLRNVIGDEMADILMEHLPPSGWGDVARKSDMDQRFDIVDHRFNIVDQRFNMIDQRFEMIDQRFEVIDQRFASMESRLNGIVQGLWALGSLTSAFFLALLTIIVTKL